MLMRGAICDEVAAFLEDVHDNNEIRTAMMKKGSGFFIVPIGCMIEERI